MNSEKLVRMANQIATFFAHEGAEKAPLSVADHLQKFWEPRMIERICAYLDDGGEGLAPAARSAVEAIAAERKVRAAQG